MPASRRPPGEGRLLQLVYYMYVGASALARWMPERVSYRIARVLGDVAAKRSKKRAQVARNLSRIVARSPESPEVQRLVAEAYRSYARYWLETFRLVRMSREFFLERLECVNEERLDTTRVNGKGAVVFVGHLGNWDAAGAWAAASGRPVATAAEVLRPQRMFDFFAEHRARLGITIYPAQKGVTKRLAEELEKGKLVALLGDRDLKGVGPVVRFFGEDTTMPAGPASLALQKDVPLVVAGVFECELEDGSRGWKVVVSEEVEKPGADDDEPVRTLTQRSASVLEDFVRQAPEQWHVFQPFWLADRR